MQKKLLFGFVGILALIPIVNAVDSGGVSVDLRMIDRKQKNIGQSVNLVKDGDFENLQIDITKYNRSWNGGCYDWGDGDLSVKIRKIPRRTFEATSGVNNSRCIKLTSPLSIQKLRDAKGNPMLFNSVEQEVEVPDSPTPVKYELTFMIKGQLFEAPGYNCMHYFVRFEDKVPGKYGVKQLRKETNKTVNLTGKYVKHSFNFIAPPHTRRLTVRFCLYGLGEAYLDNVEVRQVKMTKEVKAFVTPFSFLDNTFCIGEKQVGALTFVLQNELQLPCQDLTLHLQVPQGFEVLAGNSNTSAMTKKKISNEVTEVSFNIQSVVDNIPRDGYGMWRKPTVIIAARRPAGKQLFPLTYFLSNKGQRGTPNQVNLKVIPAVKGERPQKFITGFQCTHEFNVDRSTILRVRDLLNHCGFNGLFDGGSNLRRELGQDNFFRSSSNFYVSNGYHIGSSRNRTPESFFRLVNGEKFVDMGDNTCPTEVYKRGKFYRQNVLPILEDTIGKNAPAEHLMSNWEPYYFDFKGCFCERCREEFVQYMKGQVDAAQIRADWPRKIIDKYEKAWVKFRSAQHGKVCQTLEEDINRIGKAAGKNSHFVPEVAWSQLIETTYKDFAQFSVMDYWEKLPIILPWGPYIFSDFTKSYEYFTGIHLITYFAAQAMPDFVVHRISDPAKRPQLIAFPHGVQCGSWITEPEALSFEYICFFLHHWDGVLAYYFPQGYDQRYFNALASVNKIMAQHEKVVQQGQNISAQVQVTPRSPLPKAIFPNYWNEGGNFKQKLPKIVGASVLQHRAFALGNERVIALGNFWQRGEVFAQVKIVNLKPNQTYQVNSSDNYSLGRFTGRQLSQGILAHIGALRWNFLRVTPQKSSLQVIDQKQMHKIYQDKLPNIKKAYQAELVYHEKLQGEAAQENPVNDFKSIYPIQQKQISLKAVKVQNRDYIEVKTPAYRVLIDPAAGGVLASATLHGKELVNTKVAKGLGMVAFWSPRRLAHNVQNGFKISGMQKTSDGIVVELTRTITRLEKNELQDLKIVKTWHFKGNEFGVKTILTNGQKNALNFSFRYNNMPRHLQSMSGVARFADNVKFTRDRVLKMVRCAAPDPHIDGLYGINKFLNSRTCNFTLSAPQLPDVKIGFPEKSPHGIVFWDARNSSTMEPVFPMTILQPGQSASFAMTWSW